MSFKNKNVLVTGISGFVGSYLADYLVQQEANVYGLFRRRADGYLDGRRRQDSDHPRSGHGPELGWVARRQRGGHIPAGSGDKPGARPGQRRQLVHEWLEKALQAQVRTEPQEQIKQDRRQNHQDMVGNRIEAPHQRGD